MLAAVRIGLGGADTCFGVPRVAGGAHALPLIGADAGPVAHPPKPGQRVDPRARFHTVFPNPSCPALAHGFVAVEVGVICGTADVAVVDAEFAPTPDPTFGPSLRNHTIFNAGLGGAWTLVRRIPDADVAVNAATADTLAGLRVTRPILTRGVAPPRAVRPIPARGTAAREGVASADSARAGGVGAPGFDGASPMATAEGVHWCAASVLPAWAELTRSVAPGGSIKALVVTVA